MTKKGEKGLKAKKPMKKMKCWEVFHCNKKKCPVFSSKDLRCWLYSGTQCREEIQGKFLEKIELCLDCEIFRNNMDISSMEASLKLVNSQIKEFTKTIGERDRELEVIGMELALGLSEVFEALRKIASGDPAVRVSEKSKIELIRKLKHMVNLTAEEIGEIVDQSHEIAIGLAEHFDILHRVSRGDMKARVSAGSKMELLKSLRKVTNKMIGSIDKEINERKRAERALQKAHVGLEQRIQERTAKLTETNIKLKKENIERRKADEALLESERKYKTLTENSLTGIFIHQNGKFVFVNERFAKIHGYKPEELIGKKHLILIHPDDREIMKEVASKRLKGKSVPQRYESRRVRKDGKIIWCEMMVNRIKYRGTPAIMGNIVNITKRKLADEAIKKSEEQLRNLTSYLQRMTEIERTNIAREIHDELGQTLTVLKIEMSWLKKKLPGDQESKIERIEGMLKLVDRTIKTVKKISSNLRPGLLDDLGLAAAIEWQAEEFERRTGIQCIKKISPKEIFIDRDRDTALFRIFQETLTNVARHAKATRVNVRVREHNAFIELRVQDNGRGITTEELTDPGSLGLIGIQERAKIFGGDSTFKGLPGEGTTVTVRIPTMK
jgi:PAS domain S-box-containing protein